MAMRKNVPALYCSFCRPCNYQDSAHGISKFTLFIGIISFAQWILIGSAACAALWFVIHQVVKPLVDMGRGKIHYANDNFAIYSVKGETRVHDHRDEKNVYNWRGEIGQGEPLALPSGELPQLVRYEDVKRMVPAGHTLIGVGAAGRVVSRPRDVNALIWIVGNSGMGKTNTVMLRIDEDAESDTQFLGVDPHYFKDDSLAHAITGTKYAQEFTTPTGQPFENGTRFASETEDICLVCDAYLAEFERRRSGGTWKRPLHLVIDEASALTFKPTTPREKDMVGKIQRCMLITQTATGMAWLRKYALVVYVHKLLMMNERELACNENRDIARQMDYWPKGRTVVYGIAFDEGMQVVQQPLLARPPAPPAMKEQIAFPLKKRLEVNGEVPGSETSPPARFQPQPYARQTRALEMNGETGGNGFDGVEASEQRTLEKTLRELGKRVKSGEQKSAILAEIGITTGRAYQEASAALDVLAALEE